MGIGIFPGQYFESETGLHYNWHRYYNPETGRYLRTDPIGILPFGQNGELNHLFNYASNDPINKTDPLGLFWSGNFWPGFDEQDDICSSPVGEFNNNECFKKCCKEHDDCYKRNGCNWSSWVGTFSAFPFVPACQQCNRDAVKCILKAKIKGEDCECQ